MSASGSDRDDDPEPMNELIEEREFAAPPELVFEMWTVPEHFARWFGPHGVTVPMCELDARPGGKLRMQHLSAAGELVTFEAVFDDVLAPSRLQFTFTFVDAEGRPTAPPQVPDWPPGVHITITVELEPSPRGTRMVVRQRVVEPEAARIPAVIRHGKLAKLGWAETTERLAAYLASTNVPGEP